MNAAILYKTIRETRWFFALLMVVIPIFETLIVWAVSQFATELTEIWFKFPFLKKLITALVGADLSEQINPTSLVTIGLAHPFLYAVTWAFLITTCTRVIVGEIDRGTADLLLTLPVSRAGVYAVVSLVWILAGAAICVVPLLGIWLGERVIQLGEPLDFARLWTPIFNFFALYVAIGCITMLVSSLNSRRGLAVGIVIALLLTSFLLNFAVALIPPLGPWSFLGLLHYYRPLESVRSASMAWGHIAALFAIALVTWSVGLWTFHRRDVPAV